jgi:hypothetical protein
MPTIEPHELPWRPAQQALLPLAEAAEPITTRLGERWPMNIFEHIRRAIITLLRAEKVEFDPSPLALARGALRRRIDKVEIRATGVPIEDTDVVIRPQHDRVHGATTWLLSRDEGPHGLTVAKMRITRRTRPKQLRVHPGRDWFTVLSGTVILRRSISCRCWKQGRKSAILPPVCKNPAFCAPALPIFYSSARCRARRSGRTSL